MPNWRFLAADLLTGTVREEIPLWAVRFQHDLNGPGSLRATIPVRHPKATRATLDPSRTILVAERDGTVLWAGILWAVRKPPGDDLSLYADGLWSYFWRRTIRHTQTFTGEDQFTIARSLVDYAQSQPMGDIGIDTGSGLSGRTRDRTYEAWQRKPVAEAVEQLAAVRRGFDFHIHTAWDGDALTHMLQLSYPHRGSEIPRPLDLGVNIDGYGWESDGTRQANLVDAIGAGDEDFQIIETAADTNLGYPLLEAVVYHKDITVSATLEGHAASVLSARRAVPEIGEITVRGVAPGSITTGDRLLLRIDDGWVQHTGLHRVHTVGVELGDDGEERVFVVPVPLDASQSEVLFPRDLGLGELRRRVGSLERSLLVVAGRVRENEIADTAVTEDKIADTAVTVPKLDAPVAFATGDGGGNGFTVEDSVWNTEAIGSITVPAWAGSAAVTAVASAEATNLSGDTGFLLVRTLIGGSDPGGFSQAVSVSRAHGAFSGTVTSTLQRIVAAPGATISIEAQVQSSVPSTADWGNEANNYARIVGLAAFTRT